MCWNRCRYEDKEGNCNLISRVNMSLYLKSRVQGKYNNIYEYYQNEHLHGAEVCETGMAVERIWQIQLKREEILK